MPNINVDFSESAIFQLEDDTLACGGELITFNPHNYNQNLMTDYFIEKMWIENILIKKNTNSMIFDKSGAYKIWAVNYCPDYFEPNNFIFLDELMDLAQNDSLALSEPFKINALNPITINVTNVICEDEITVETLSGEASYIIQSGYIVEVFIKGGLPQSYFGFGGYEIDAVNLITGESFVGGAYKANGIRGLMVAGINTEAGTAVGFPAGSSFTLNVFSDGVMCTGSMSGSLMLPNTPCN